MIAGHIQNPAVPGPGGKRLLQLPAEVQKVAPGQPARVPVGGVIADGVAPHQRQVGGAEAAQVFRYPLRNGPAQHGGHGQHGEHIVNVRKAGDEHGVISFSAISL